ncbi:MAG: hypothetical protein JWM80_6032 [Cyanobacteria bacterium RYN_339]|nr:hypothetical protein [Cyanobacteria bacterium RYN_339]
MILAMPDRLTWKSVFFIWMLCVPFVGGASVVLYQKYPGPFQQAATWSKQQADHGQKAYKDYQAKRAKDKAKADKQAKDEAEADNGY